MKEKFNVWYNVFICLIYLVSPGLIRLIKVQKLKSVLQFSKVLPLSDITEYKAVVCLLLPS